MSDNFSLIKKFGLDLTLKIEDEKRVDEIRKIINSQIRILSLEEKENNYNRKLNTVVQNEYSNYEIEPVLRFKDYKVKENILPILVFSSFSYLYLTRYSKILNATTSLRIYKPLCIFTFTIAPVILGVYLTKINLKINKLKSEKI